MATPYKIKPQVGDFAVHLTTDDFGKLIADPIRVAELRALLDRYMVLHISPTIELTKQVVGDMAFELGFPKERRNGGRGPSTSPTAVPGYEFVADFGSKAKPNLAEPRIPSYIESLHYDGISGYSMQANFNVPPTTPNLWVDMRAAYKTLPVELKKIVDKHAALHAVVPPPGTALADFPGFDAGASKRRALVIKHHRTGEPLLYLPKNLASKIDGMPEKEGRDILFELWEHVNTTVTRYASHVAHNNLVIWDGLGTVHTNPAYPRDKDRTTWFLIVPGKFTEVESYYA